ITFLAGAEPGFLEFRATAPRDCSVPVAVGSGTAGATGVCWATEAARRSAKTKAQSRLRRKPTKVGGKKGTLNRIRGPNQAKDDQSFGPIGTAVLPAVS